MNGTRDVHSKDIFDPRNMTGFKRTEPADIPVLNLDPTKGKPEQQVFLGLEIADWRSPARHPRFEATFVAILGGFRNFRQTPP